MTLPVSGWPAQLLWSSPRWWPLTNQPPILITSLPGKRLLDGSRQHSLLRTVDRIVYGTKGKIYPKVLSRSEHVKPKKGIGQVDIGVRLLSTNRQLWYLFYKGCWISSNHFLQWISELDYFLLIDNDDLGQPLRFTISRPQLAANQDLHSLLAFPRHKYKIHNAKSSHKIQVQILTFPKPKQSTLTLVWPGCENVRMVFIYHPCYIW